MAKSASVQIMATLCRGGALLLAVTYAPNEWKLTIFYLGAFLWWMPCNED